MHTLSIYSLISEEYFQISGKHTKKSYLHINQFKIMNNLLNVIEYSVYL